MKFRLDVYSCLVNYINILDKSIKDSKATGNDLPLRKVLVGCVRVFPEELETLNKNLKVEIHNEVIKSLLMKTYHKAINLIIHRDYAEADTSIVFSDVRDLIQMFDIASNKLIAYTNVQLKYHDSLMRIGRRISDPTIALIDSELEEVNVKYVRAGQKVC